MMDIDVDPLEIKGTLWSSVATGENEKIQDDLAKNSKITQKKPRSNISVDEYERACRDRFAVENLKFERLIHYLKANKHPEGLTNNEKKQIYRLSSTHQWDATEGILYCTVQDKVKKVVRSMGELANILRVFHASSPSGGHVGQTATQEKISKLYTWKNMTDDIRHYIETCEECHPLETQDPLKQSIKLEEVWKLNEVDVIGTSELATMAALKGAAPRRAHHLLHLTALPSLCVSCAACSVSTLIHCLLSDMDMDEPVMISNFIGGEMVPCPHHLDSHEPSTGRVWAKVPDSGQAEVDAAVSAAHAAFEGWSSKSAQTRANHLLRIADILESRLELFAEAESRDQGKPVWLARTLDIPRCVHNLRHFAHAIPHHLNKSSVNPEVGVVNYTLREPQGVAGLISPWNLPLYLLTFKLAPALMCGNTVVAKPSEMTSVTAYMFCKVLQDADLPAGVVNMVFGRGPSAGQALITHPQVPLVSFTGSTATGRHIALATAPLFKKLSLEMGGKNAAVLFDDCEMDSCLDTLKRSCFVNSGQVCLCTSRIFVHQSVFKEFLERFVSVAREVKVGPPSKKESFMGPLNSKPHLAKVLKYITYAVEDGGEVLCGPEVDRSDLPALNKEGYFMRPTVITGLSDKSRCIQEEIFGPVTCVLPFDTEEEVIHRVNDTPYGLCASVFTSNLARGHRVAHKLKVGTVWTNCWLVRDLDMPFGGVKSSGLGRESTQDSLEFYTEAKTVCTKI